MFKPITIKDIAQALDLSPSTVSRALSDSYEINEETKKRVIEYAEQHSYRRNPMASSLRHGRSYSIGVIVCEVANSFFSQAIDGIESVAYGKGYHVIISQSHDAYEREVVNIQHLANRAVDGLLISMSAETKDFSHIITLHEQGLPIVFFDRIIDVFDTHTVTSDNKKGAQKATQSLIDRGFKKIAHLANAPHLSITAERLEGFESALRANNIPLNESLIRYCHHGGRIQREVEEAVRYFLDLDERPDAIFVASDRLSMGCLSAYNKLAPKAEHPAIAGFSNSDVLDLLQPGFTCIRQPAIEMGRVAMEMLIQLIESRYPVYEFENTVLETELISR
ncbi:LacI family transcriptional regulator [Parapedobacter pyrenivorans]|uniref:LacI family transcriptional regulator n=1 Tax=Parapedobacter pyrenivorans TaxID=1305674 RepID=A0A917MDG8_9SPHI|nr:LacI family DNA-binding transcriptional regulator [Parapedobacter pyrenivorans]GGG95259.1 LacI family transcriptional regulator [Parapedobacter pyrenivorans]